MRLFLSRHAGSQAQAVERVRYFLNQGLSIAAACRAANVSRDFYYDHKQLIESERKLVKAG